MRPIKKLSCNPQDPGSSHQLVSPKKKPHTPTARRVTSPIHESCTACIVLIDPSFNQWSSEGNLGDDLHHERRAWLTASEGLPVAHVIVQSMIPKSKVWEKESGSRQSICTNRAAEKCSASHAETLPLLPPQPCSVRVHGKRTSLWLVGIGGGCEGTLLCLLLQDLL
jgi:hypothetical protein